MAAQLDTLICQGCGARLSYAAGLQALQCDYCDAVTPIAHAAPTAGTAAQRIIPLSVEENALAFGVLRHLAANDLVPDDMVERAVLTVNCFYMPCFAFTVSYSASWTASFGYNRTEMYTDHVLRHVDGQSRRVPVTKSRTVVDWRPVNGQDANKFLMLAYAGSGLAPAALPLLDRLQNMILARPFDAAFASGVETQPYALPQHIAYSMHAEARVASVVETCVKGHAQGEQQRDWHWNASTSWEASAVYVPVGHVVIAYGGKQYNAWVDGTFDANLVTDALPANLDKGKHALRGMIAPLLATGALMLSGMASTSFFYEMQAERVAAVGVLWGLSIWRDKRRAKRSRQSRQAALAKRARHYAQPAPTPAPELASAGSGPDLVSLAMSLVSAVIVGVLLYKLVNDPQAPPKAVAAAAAVTAPAADAAAVAPAGVYVNMPVKPVQPLSPMLVAVNARDWATVRTLTEQARPQEPVSETARKASAGLLQQGAKELLDKNYKAAIVALGIAVDADGANLAARSALGAALIGAGDHERARMVLAKLLEAAPDHVEGWRNMAEAAALADQPAEADASLRMLLHLSKDRKRTTDALKKRAAAGEPDQFSEAVARVLKPAAKKRVK
ncbi:tetratricopeptide repeat protein [Massilia rubra]|uniref:Tetratricopeptide repeat protein n=1 Tax=Massilia rubra TaxID=2607910 RepID=A0ABX0LWS4_9BURK|nr:tetratricopeptide repeat protein [Massilia rubra]NHZ34521.1 tetratricopeptide repeat protein [Massilia rubra]